MPNKIYIVGIIILIVFSGYQLIGQSSGQKEIEISNIELATIVDGKQTIKMTAHSLGYSPNYFKLKTGIPVRWEISATTNAGCANALVAPEFIKGTIWLTPGGTTVQEFTPTISGKYRFSCAMGMYTGIFEVIN